MITAVLAFSDRLPRDHLLVENGYIGERAPQLTGNYFRTLLEKTVSSFLDAGVEEVIVVNWHHKAYPEVTVPGARILQLDNVRAFSEWDAKWEGIKAARNDLIITTNADILANAAVVDWFHECALAEPLCLYQGTKGWLNEHQTEHFLATREVWGCRHEVIVDVVDNSEMPVDGIEPAIWADRRPACKIYYQRLGIDLWKNSGDFQAFHRDVLNHLSYPLGTKGWGWGDNEIRLRAIEAGIGERWNRSDPVWHMFHPFQTWKCRELQVTANMEECGTQIDWNVGGSGWVLPPTDDKQRMLAQSAPYCCLHIQDFMRNEI